MAFSGKYTCVGEENFIQFLKDQGLSEAPADNPLSKGGLKFEIKQDGDKFTTISTNSAGETIKTTNFTLGTEFEESVGGKSFKNTAKVNGKSLILSSSGNEFSRFYNLTDDGLEIIYKTSKGEGKLIFKKD